MMGGYLDKDCTIQGEGLVPEPAVYNIRNWQIIDSFCYFSHNRVTIPPACWINCGHINGTKVLGTFITEWGEGFTECQTLLKDPIGYSEKLAKLMQRFSFDGWLLNIENKITPESMPSLFLFVNTLTEACHKYNPLSLVLWYDSVTVEGALEWQNQLTPRNIHFFGLCDGLFTNYCWKPGFPKTSSELAGARKYDIYTGIDVFGRHTPFGPGFECCQSVESIANDTSVALFAPGWVYENLEKSDFIANNSRFWNQLQQNFAIQPLEFQPGEVFCTTFDQGYGNSLSVAGKNLTSTFNSPWVNINFQELLPSYGDPHSFIYQNGASVSTTIVASSQAFSGGSLLEIKSSEPLPALPDNYAVDLFSLNYPCTGKTIVTFVVNCDTISFMLKVESIGESSQSTHSAYVALVSQGRPKNPAVHLSPNGTVTPSLCQEAQAVIHLSGAWIQMCFALDLEGKRITSLSALLSYSETSPVVRLGGISIHSSGMSQSPQPLPQSAPIQFTSKSYHCSGEESGDILALRWDPISNPEPSYMLIHYRSSSGTVPGTGTETGTGTGTETGTSTPTTICLGRTKNNWFVLTHATLQQLQQRYNNGTPLSPHDNLHIEPVWYCGLSPFGGV
ncbi:cytosolic endo-beta-N-acetylglucosaminidase 2 [Pelomyxa schiedti]|nr:cytosolic endo-beta-N-acetylglucosaminidase 2 [Pelomyxa schiedti]